MHMNQNSISSKFIIKSKKSQMESESKMYNQSNKENSSFSSNRKKENTRNIINFNQDICKLNNDILSVKNYSNAASQNMDNLYSGDFGSKFAESTILNSISVKPFKDYQNENIKIKDLMDEDSVFAFESLHAPIKRAKIENGSSVSFSRTPKPKSFFDLMKNMNFSSLNHSKTSMFVSKPKKSLIYLTNRNPHY